MPFYAFECEHCHEVFDVRPTIKEREAGLHPECPNCHDVHVKPLITAGLVVHGGDGGSVSSSFPACGCGSGGCCG
jgi:putative FmdB family regulatory protein